jgi:hypothetical protein
MLYVIIADKMSWHGIVTEAIDPQILFI